MWWLKALAIWLLVSLATTALIGRFLAGKYFKEQAKPNEQTAADDELN